MGKKSNVNKTTAEETKTPTTDSNTPFNPFENLTESQLETFKEFDELCSKLELDEREKKWLTDMCKLRYLRAREYNIDQSFAMLKKTLAWRKEYKPHEITAEHLSFENATGKQYVNGKVKCGKPVIYMRPSRENTKTYERQIQLMVYILERSIEHMDEGKGVEQVALMIDFSGYSMFKMPPTSVSKQCLDILSDHYPERLGYAFIIDPPMIFNVFWSFISPFINKTTSRKINFLKGEKQRNKVLQVHFEEEVLESEYGGKCEYKYDRTVHWREEIIYDRKKRSLPELSNEELEAILALDE